MTLIQKYPCKNAHKISATKKGNRSLDYGIVSEMLVLFYFKILINVVYYITLLKGENHMIVKIDRVK